MTEHHQQRQMLYTTHLTWVSVATHAQRQRSFSIGWTLPCTCSHYLDRIAPGATGAHMNQAINTNRGADNCDAARVVYSIRPAFPC